jgi:hypothetical protein
LDKYWTSSPKTKILAIVSGLFLLVIIVLIGIIIQLNHFYNRNQTKTSQEVFKEKNTIALTNPPGTWLDYQSDYGFEIFYPPGWKKLVYPDQSSIELIGSLAKNNQEACQSEKEICTPFIAFYVYDSLDSLKSSLGLKNNIGGTSLENVVLNLNKIESYQGYTMAYPIYLGDYRSYVLTAYDLNDKDKPDKTIFFLENNNFKYQIIFKAVNAFTQLEGDQKAVLTSLRLTTPKKQKIEPFKEVITDWKSYENLEDKYKLNIPTNWQAAEENNVVSLRSSEEQMVWEWCQYQFCQWPLESMRIKRYGSLLEFTSGYSYETTPRNYQNIDEFLADVVGKSIIAKHSKAKLENGLDAYELETGGMGVDLVYLISQNNTVYEITFFNTASSSELNSTDKEILKSFQFTA